MLFRSNLDVFYPALYGAVLLSVLPSASRTTQVVGGAAAAVAVIAKLHPAPLLLWVAVRAVRSRGGQDGRVLAAALVTGVVVLLASLLIGGTGPWLDYLTVVRVAGGASLVDSRNAGPVSLLGLLTGLDGSVLIAIQLAVVVAVAVVTVVAGARVRDPLTGFAIVAVASLVTLPITWYHYLGALVPVAIALAVRFPSARMRIAVAAVVADIAIGFLPVMWIGVAILLVAARGDVAARPGSRPVLVVVR